MEDVFQCIFFHIMSSNPEIRCRKNVVKKRGFLTSNIIFKRDFYGFGGEKKIGGSMEV